MTLRNSFQLERAPDIMVFVDLPDGELDDAGRGILSEASRLAGTLETEWSAVSFAGAEQKVLAEFANYELDRLTLIEAPPEAADSFEIQGRLIALAAREAGAGLVFLPHNDLGDSLAPLLAAELDAALFTEAIAYELDDGELKLSHQTLGSQVAELKRWDGRMPLVLTMNPKALSGVVLPNMRCGMLQIEHWQPAIASVSAAARIVERIPPDPQTVDVSEAEVIISAGLGCNPESFAMVEELTRLLGASLGVTRPVYDLDYADFERMVGQTGKTVAPRLYLALGISGSMHHLGGIKDSKKIVAVNIDPKAPIFPNADEGFVADLREVLPLLLERLKSATGVAA